MIYNWEKIVESKTNQELYDIVIGRTILTKEAVKYAKAELENRNFDFANMEANHAAWKLSSLIDEEDNAISEITGQRVDHISIKILFLIVVGIFMAYFFVPKFTNYDFPIDMALFFIVFSTIIILLNNFLAKRQKQAQQKRLEEIDRLKEKLENENLLTSESPIHKELMRQRINGLTGIKTYYNIAFGISVIVILLIVLSKIL